MSNKVFDSGKVFKETFSQIFFHKKHLIPEPNFRNTFLAKVPKVACQGRDFLKASAQMFKTDKELIFHMFKDVE